MGIEKKMAEKEFGLNRCFNCNYFEFYSSIEGKLLCRTCFTLYIMAKKEECGGMFCQMIRLKAVIKGNQILEKIAQNMHKNFFLNIKTNKGIIKNENEN